MNISVLLLRPLKPECGTAASFQFGGVKRRKGLGVTLPTDRWDKNRQRIKVSGSLHRDERTFLMGLNKRIEHHVKAIQDAVHILTYELEREPTWEELSAALDRLNAGKENINETTLTFYQWVEEFITESEEHRTNAKGQKLHPRTIAKYRTVLTQLKDFARGHLGRGMKFEDWNEELVNRYKSFRASQGCKVSTIGKDLAVIKVWLKKAHHRKLHDSRSYLEPYFVPPKHRGLKVHLTLDDLDVLEHAELPSVGKNGKKLKALHVVRDLFVVACWTGVRYSDLKRFPELLEAEWSANKGQCPSELAFIQDKTDDRVRVPILDPVNRILTKYNGRLPKVMSNQKMNRVIKEVMAHAGLTRTVEMASSDVRNTRPIKRPFNELVTLHTARRTFATNMWELQVLSAGELRSLTGHESEQALLLYLNVDREKVAQRAGEKIRKALRMRA